MTAERLTLGQFLDQARRENGLSIRQLAELSDVLKTTVGRLLLDQVKEPKADHLVRLAQVLELNANDLFLMAGLPEPSGIPTVEALLRTEYDLPEVAIREAKKHIEGIVARYGNSPAPATPLITNRSSRKEGHHEQT